ncbi:hypothetical protein E2562_013867 [Oryza meyeriana var. granulata]|uniref:Uncharacterized protein n=1 Tax=Oryza meyeriana var. granulata TaxID=110450 RepID=A0A6G1C5U8_9ORYZ|nr:hypothetical protein E2562_013867 [Oryza meyeriana var. granulata]
MARDGSRRKTVVEDADSSVNAVPVERSSSLTIHKMSDDPFSTDHHDPASNTIDILEDFLAEDDILDDLVDETVIILKSTVEALQEAAYDPRSGPRKYIKRPREQFH